MGCVFCEIVAGERAAHIVLDDEVALAFLDARPLFKGHTLLVPRSHRETLTDLEAVGPFFERAQLLAAAMEDVLGAAGSFVAMNNRISQSVPHLHVHVVPRNRKDGLRGFFWPRTKYDSDAEAASYAKRLREAVQGGLSTVWNGSSRPALRRALSVTNPVAIVTGREEYGPMATLAKQPAPAGGDGRIRVSWPPTPEKLYDALTVPRGYRKEVSDGLLRIGHRDGKVDQRLLDLAERIADRLPELCRLEIYGGQIVVGGCPRLAHNRAVARAIGLFSNVSKRHGWMLCPTTPVVNPHTREHVIPDFVIVPANPPVYDEAFCGHGVLLVSEVTSPGNAKDDRTHKVRFYGRAGVPLYLLIDIERDEVVLYSEPWDEGYRSTVRVPVGAPLKLPVPFSMTIDTAEIEA